MPSAVASQATDRYRSGFKLPIPNCPGDVMRTPMDPRPGGPTRPGILTINGGSSSLKFAVFAAEGRPERVLAGRVERVGLGASRLIVAGVGDRPPEGRDVEAPDQAAAAGVVIELVERGPGLAS